MNDCRLPNCKTCGPTPDPLDQGPVGLVYWWLLDCYPEIWAERASHTRLRAAHRIVKIQQRAWQERQVAP